MPEWAPTILQYGFMQRALVACVALCLAAPLVGAFVVQRRQSLVGDGIGHVAFAGVGGAFLLGTSPAVGAFSISIVGAYALYRLQRGGLGGDLSLALLFYGGIAVGFVFASRSGIGLNSLLGYLFGSPLNLTWPMTWLVVGCSVATVLLVIAIYRPLTAVAFDESAARVSGVPVDGLVLALTLLVAVVVVGGMHVVGVLLVAGMMVIPVAAGSKVARSYRGTLGWASAFGGISAVAGLLIAFYADLTPGGMIVISAVACYALARAWDALRRRIRDDRRERPDLVEPAAATP